ncbi:MAG: hypothetical protein ACKPKO_39220 [Candidatus Fonsibacter sp.]
MLLSPIWHRVGKANYITRFFTDLKFGIFLSAYKSIICFIFSLFNLLAFFLYNF